MIKSAIGNIIEHLKRDNRIVTLPDNVTASIEDELSRAMREFDQDFARKEAKSKSALAKIILRR